MSATVDQVILWQSRLDSLAEKVVTAEDDAEGAMAEVSRLLTEEASKAKVEQAKVKTEKACSDLGHLIKARQDAEEKVEIAKKEQAEEVSRQRGQRIERLQKKRAHVLGEAEDLFKAFLDKLAESEALAVEIHSASSGARPAQEAINDRHTRLIQWIIVRLVETMPIAKTFLGSIAANMNHARKRLEGVDLSGTQADYASEFRRHERMKLDMA